MEIKIIEETRLPDVSMDVRTRVTSGRWAMYNIKYEANPEFEYMLSTETRDYMLGATGMPLAILEKRVGVVYVSRIYFEIKTEPKYIEISL